MGVAARLLLVVVLALGVFIMHTVGHPADGSATGTASPSHMTSMAGIPGHGRGADAVPDTGLPPAPRTADAAAGPEQAIGPAPADVPGTALDMASLCLAVLGSWALAALLHTVFVGRRVLFASLATRVLAAARPDPPRAPDLAQLSILRI
ncbi:DUF6153 family protein [Streptomyces sp. HNM0645]|uniref:DUF6153 family protein n=1 Tax=Streptomyces sp. HNM0645 TaxID=2782343 RepID=UPI0024B66D44|nr:DUF6153 family protein [Streptomyces sp. HNM0645]MDI9888096.1 DUF6153 family protein [Streptomyces sp. HNM0645]